MTRNQAHSRSDYLKAIDFFYKGMKGSSKVITQGRSVDKVSEIRERCRTAANRYLQVVIQYNKRPGDKLNIFNAVLDAFNCHVTPTWMIDAGIIALGEWAKDVFSRQVRDVIALDILSQKLRELECIKHHLSDAKSARNSLIGRVVALEEEIYPHLKKQLDVA